MNEKEFREVLECVLNARAAKKASLKGIERMRYNLYWRVYPRMLKETDFRCVTVGELTEWVVKYAPKAIRNNRAELEMAIDEVWMGTHGYSIYSEDFLREDLDWEMNHIFNKDKAA
jgi:hypothetical protein